MHTTSPDMAGVMTRASERAFVTSHPWLSFKIDLANADWRLWQNVGEARSKCRHLMFAPLKPGIRRDLEAVYLAKGMQATTAIEGNTLSYEQVRAAVDGELHVPPSQEYLKQEVENVLAACRDIEHMISRGEGGFEITVDLLKMLNERVLRDLEVEDHVIPGEFTRVSVGVGGYRGAPVEDLEYLTDRLCAWLNGPDFEAANHSDAFLHVVLKALAAHVYIAWIHPFGDGNGRTARLIEFGILTAAGVPSVAAHLLSNHYNLTRSAYYKQLDRASRSDGDLGPFVAYAMQGFVDLLQEQLGVVHSEMFSYAWENFVHEHFSDQDTLTGKRRRELVLELGRRREPVPRDQIRQLTPRLAEAYAGKQSKTITRDLNAVVESGLVTRDRRGLVAKRDLMYGFTPRWEVNGNVLVDFSRL
jgi:Fic family protein